MRDLPAPPCLCVCAWQRVAAACAAPRHPQVACESLGPAKKGGRVIGVDLQETRRPDRFCDERVLVFQGDARDLGPAFWDEHAPGGFDAVLSDM